MFLLEASVWNAGVSVFSDMITHTAVGSDCSRPVEHGHIDAHLQCTWSRKAYFVIITLIWQMSSLLFVDYKRSRFWFINYFLYSDESADLHFAGIVLLYTNYTEKIENCILLTYLAKLELQSLRSLDIKLDFINPHTCLHGNFLCSNAIVQVNDLIHYKILRICLQSRFAIITL